MAATMSTVKVPPPKSYTIYALGITGLPHALYSHVGWQLVKDLVRVILQHHDLIERHSNAKPGMVHMKISWIEEEVVDEDQRSSIATFKTVKKPVITAYVNMKSSEAAWHAWSTIDGNSLWGYSLTAQVFPDPTDDATNQKLGGEVWAPAKWRKPHDLADRFTITLPGGKYFWTQTLDGKLAKVLTDNTKERKRQAKERSVKKPGSLARSTSDLSTCSTLVDASPPPYQQPSHEGVSDENCVLPPGRGFAVDFYGNKVRFQQTHRGQTYEATRYPRWDMHATMRETSLDGTRYPTLEDIKRQ